MNLPRGADFKVLLGILVVAGLVWAFVAIADEVAEGDFTKLDDRILLAFRVEGHPDRPVGPPWVANAARDLTSLGSTAVLVLVTAATAGYLFSTGRRRAGFFLLGAVIGGAALSFALKLGFDRPRPEIVGHLDRPLSSSFPSGHSMVSAVVYLTLGALLARSTDRRGLKIYFLGTAVLLALTIGLTRVFLGVHYPSDVLAGWTAGAAWALLCLVLARFLERRGAIEPT